ncbi:MAG TPA: phage holin family protein [Casimicrobiaceae bacterium]
MPDPGAERPAAGLGGALSGFAATTVAMLRTRLELATVEFEEERERTKIMLLLVVIATVFSCFALVALSVLIVALLWSSYPLGALVGVVLAYVIIAVLAWYLVRQNARAQGRPFAATLSELERDADALRRGR